MDVNFNIKKSVEQTKNGMKIQLRQDSIEAYGRSESDSISNTLDESNSNWNIRVAGAHFPFFKQTHQFLIEQSKYQRADA